MAALAAILVAPIASAGTINSFADWGISTVDLSSSVADVTYVTEDQKDNYLNPGYGGQAYDAEGIYVTTDSNYLYVGVMTGRAQSGGSWAPGDIAFDLGSDNSFEYGLITSSYTGSASSTGGIGNPGEFFAVSEWNYGIWDSAGNYVGQNSASADTEHPTSVKTGSKLGDAAAFNYSGGFNGYGTWQSDTHYFISAKIDLSWFGGHSALSSGYSIHWAANCNNDWLQLDVDATSVPEPGSLFLLSLAMLGLAGAQRKRKQA